MTVKSGFRFMLVVGLCKGIVFPQWGRRGTGVFGPDRSTPSTPRQPTPSVIGQDSKSTSQSQPIAVSIRKSHHEDLPKVAAFLSLASSPQGNGFQARIDRMFAKDDIEKLLESRWLAIHEAQRSWDKLSHRVNVQDETVSDVRRHWWTTSDRLRSSIASAVSMTAEPTMFDSSIDVMPQPYALQHLQLTACCKNTNRPIGFCEVAMEPPHGQPLILNVAVDPKHQRRGVGRQLLRTAERYVRRYWQTGNATPTGKGLGLYVDPSNHAAIKLYRSLGYTIVPALVDEAFEGPRDPHGQPMTYMFKAFSSTSSSGVEKPELMLVER